MPSGVVQFFEPLSSIRRQTENKLIDMFKKNGYQEIITPTFVYEDSVSKLLFEPLKNKLFKIVDKNSGQTMILRADITLQVTQAVLLGNMEMPVRVCYAQNVYRDVKEHLGQKREFKQVGIELFGIKELDADIEVVRLAIDGLMSLGINDLYVKVSDTHIIEKVIEKYDLGPEKASTLRELVFKKALSRIKKENFPKDLEKELETLQLKSGFVNSETEGNEDSISLAKNIINHYPEIKIFCDFFYCEHPTYHRGITFDIFSENKRLAVGGRYGNITKGLGKYIPATGFAINLDELSYLLFERSQRYE